MTMDNKTNKHPKWENFKVTIKKAGKWTVKNLLPVAVSLAAGGLGLPAAISGLASGILKSFSDANIKIPLSKEVFQEKIRDLCKGKGRTIEFLQFSLEQANKE